MMVLVTGSRSWARLDSVEGKLDALLADHDDLVLIVGDARGADACAHMWGAGRVPTLVGIPAWNRRGKRAGIERNLVMLDLKPDLVLAFWDGESSGTKHVIDEARRRGIPVEVTT